jgi:SET family sugar efflux transporter-like MFS transporter
MSLWGRSLGMASGEYAVFMVIVESAGIALCLWLSRWSDSGATRRTVLILGATGGALGYIGYAFVTNVVLLTLIGSLALGVSTVCFTQLFAHVREELDRTKATHNDTPFLLSIQRVFFSLAWAIGPGLGAVILELDRGDGYRSIFIAASILCVLVLLGTLLFVPRREHSAAAKAAAAVPLWQVLGRRDIAFYFGGLVLFFAAHTVGGQVLPLMVTGEMGGTDRSVGVIAGLSPAFELPLMLWFGRLASRGHTVNLIRIGIAINALYFVLLTYATAPWHVWPMQLLAATAMAINTNITITFFQDLLPNQAGIATSLFANSYTVGKLIGLGVFWSRDAIGNIQLCFLCAGITVLALIAFFIRQRRPETEAPGLPTAAAAPRLVRSQD